MALALGFLFALQAFTPAPAHAAGPDVAYGEELFRKCRQCHTIGTAARHGTGPALNGIIGMKAGSQTAYRYSPAMKRAGASGVIWTAKTLQRYLKAPAAMVRGTKMRFAGLKDEADRADLIAYLARFDAKGQVRK
ncbi:MAG: cytochrome c family protein [Pseudomonadota bacterium]